MRHIRHHHEHSLLIVWLLTCLPLTLERLYRLRYLNRGLHSVRTAIDLRKWTHPQATLAKAFSPAKIIPLSYRAPSIRNCCDGCDHSRGCDGCGGCDGCRLCGCAVVNGCDGEVAEGRQVA